MKSLGDIHSRPHKAQPVPPVRGSDRIKLIYPRAYAQGYYLPPAFAGSLNCS
jgi:hypothetical protein